MTEVPASAVDWLCYEYLHPWIKKKMIEFLGEEEATLLEFVCKKLKDHATAKDILEQLTLVLDEEAESFVMKMWRFLILTMLMAASNE